MCVRTINIKIAGNICRQKENSNNPTWRKKMQFREPYLSKNTHFNNPTSRKKKNSKTTVGNFNNHTCPKNSISITIVRFSRSRVVEIKYGFRISQPLFSKFIGRH